MIGELSALLTAVFWAVTALSFEKASRAFGSFFVNVIRLIIANILLFTTIWLFNLDFVISSEQQSYLIFSGIVGLVIGDGFLFKAFQTIGAGISMIIMSLAPVFASILALWYLNEQLLPLDVVGITVTIAGIIIVVLEKNSNYVSRRTHLWLGISAALIGAIGQAVGLVLAKLAFQTGYINGFVATVYRIAAASVLMLPVFIFLYRKRKPLDMIKNNKPGFRYLLVGGFFGPYLGITASLVAITYADVGVASTIMATVPIVILPISYFWFKEKITLRTFIGAVLAVVGVGILFSG
ncbi:MAG: EamA family transporter [Gammaproteobacteria bacterium]|nr:MAG: EamA family transporter [Gammaproteobacteria bacterium]